MNIHEFQAKQLFRDYLIPVPESIVVTTAADAVVAAQTLAGDSWAIKAQVHAGGRGKVGGVKIAKTAEEARQYTAAMLGQRLVTKQTDATGLPINSVLVEKTSPIKREFYLSLLVDRHEEKLCFIASAAGGMDIEAVAEESPEKIISVFIHPAAGLQFYQCREIAFTLSLQGEQIKALHGVMSGMINLLVDKDASQIEINPLVEIADDSIVALDAKINFDDNALALHKDIIALRDTEQEDEKENKAKQFDLSYITLNGNIGCMVNGAGLAMATMDLVKLKGGTPANFLDVGGGTTTEKVTEAFKLIVSDKNVQAVLVNIFGGIVHCDVIAQGILDALKQIQTDLPVIVRLEGTHAEEGRALLQGVAPNIIAADNLDHAAEQAVSLAGARL
ncbi:MAG: ADP-forming succinate--CoA ligase subunit beta [Gammaproteobacteria bacterium]|jgi:succinyl-CoA synthetase beta subunit|nr:ADP-forming succinate--CoA ligase subunit beta [Gammaproteobacteria bacterium]MBT5222738.1 ADP-forming succinate--CoA ligase subunit beta [Gammaproteobacteria bacterium]MBT5827125.1 ADP-forming succinate--CoA ligase subunit beta [Gammaproteobacteria bacterium]MBT5967696.1 ADP-forming succinate--CoA ligase subunit beta [Gammaproteobacteria bacterium]MBT6420370.1 ADP-forming succinate--CoA ligase subunit beta [Gammaproteobacteria bacterium]